MIYEDDKFNIPEKYKNMTIEELKKEKEEILKEYKKNPCIKKKNDKYISMFKF